MSRFAYSAVIASGGRVSGTVRSASLQEAVRKVIEMGYHPLRVEEQREGGAAPPLARWWLHRVPPAHLAVFTRQLASLLKAGMPMVQALGTLRRQCENRHLAAVVGQVEESLGQDGGTLSDALEEYPAIFSPVYCGLVRSGEESGNLAEVLTSLAGHLGRSATLRGQVLGAFIYPAFLVLLGSAAVLVLMLFVIPKFQELFASFGRDLPLPTRILIATSGAMVQWWWALAALATAGAIFVLAALRRPSTRRRIDRRLLSLPVIGPMLLKVEVARLLQTFSMLLASGINMLDALRVTGNTARNSALRTTFPAVVEAVATGQGVAESFERSGLYPQIMINLMRTGEDSGELPEMLKELAAIYEEEAERAIGGTVKLLEPVLIVVMGGVIAGIVAAVILPIFRANVMVTQ